MENNVEKVLELCQKELKAARAKAVESNDPDELIRVIAYQNIYSILKGGDDEQYLFDEPAFFMVETLAPHILQSIYDYSIEKGHPNWIKINISEIEDFLDKEFYEYTIKLFAILEPYND